jgi:hypothetical protein
VIKEEQIQLAEELKRRSVPDDKIESLVSSGYFLSTRMDWHESKTLCIADSFYGTKGFSGMPPIEAFLEGRLPRARVPRYTVDSVAEIERVLNSERHARFLQSGMLAFRGQPREYTAQRPYPNPVIAENGVERLIIPSYWRQFNGDWMSRFAVRAPRSIFSTVCGDELVYYGIQDWKTLSDRNHLRYGVHSMSDLEDFPDKDSQEYGRRWREIKVEGSFRPDVPMIEQHYGFKTNGLDVTFDFRIATFFAANDFVKRLDGTAHFVPRVPGKHTGVVYGFVFRDPPLRSQEAEIKEVATFRHIPPVRPIRQRCALPFFHATNINEAVCDLDFAMYLAPNFSPIALPDQRMLFPGPEEDPFYAAALAVRQQAHPESEYQQFVEYRFD